LLNVPAPPERPPLTPEIIDTAPDEVPAAGELNDDLPIWHLIADLQVEIARLSAENERLTAEENIETVKARLIRPYANRVFCFLVGYSVFVAVVVVFHGFKIWSFQLPDGVLSVLAGTTLAAVVGLAGIILSGIFKSK
jgi:hypothetical protein